MSEQWQNCHFWVNCPFKYWQRWHVCVTSKDYNDVGTKRLSPKTLNTPAMSLKDNMGYTLHYLFMIWYIVLITLKISYLLMRNKGESVILFSVVFYSHLAQCLNPNKKSLIHTIKTKATVCSQNWMQHFENICTDESFTNRPVTCIKKMIMVHLDFMQTLIVQIPYQYTY